MGRKGKEKKIPIHTEKNIFYILELEKICFLKQEKCYIKLHTNEIKK